MKTQLIPLAGALLLVVAMRAWGSEPVRVVAVTGQQPPGTSAGTYYSTLGAHAINDSGQVAFRAELAGPSTVPADHGVWSEGGGNGLELAARRDTQVPYGAEGFHYVRVSDPHINNSGKLIFGSGMRNDATGEGRSAITVQTEQGWEAAIWRGDSAPGVSGYEIRTFNRPMFLDNHGNAMFIAFLTDRFGQGTISDNGIWVGSANQMHFVAINDAATPIPGIAPYLWDIGYPDFNDDGNVLVPGTLRGGGSSSNNDQVLMYFSPEGGRSIAAREGDPAADSPGLMYGSTLFGQLGPANHVSFRTSLLNAQGQTVVDAALFMGQPGEHRKVVQTGDAAPGAPEGSFFDDIIVGDPDSKGDIVFRASIDGPNVDSNQDFGIWAERAGELVRIALEGSAAPGTLNAQFLSISDVLVNTHGLVAFETLLAGPDVTSANDVALWIEKATGGLHLALREGDVVDVLDGPGLDLRTIKTLSIDRGLPYGRQVKFGGNGDLLVQVTFTDNSTGLVVVAVPEPSSLVLAMLALTVVGFPAWHRVRANRLA